MAQIDQNMPLNGTRNLQSSAESKPLESIEDFQEPQIKSTWRQIKAMMWKNWLTIKASKGSLAGEFIVPFIFCLMVAGVSLLSFFDCKAELDPKKNSDPKLAQDAYNSCVMVKNDFIPIFFCVLLIPNILNIIIRFIVQNIIADKENKVRETLQLMSVSTFSYSLSYLLFQGILATMQAIIICTGFFVQADRWFETDTGPKCVLLLLTFILLFISFIPTAMALSTIFNDSRVGQQFAGLLAFIPIIIFMVLIQIEGNAKYVMYAAYIFPVTPALIIFFKLFVSKVPNLPADTVIIFNVDYIDDYSPWFALVISIPLWLLFYMYLDQVTPSTYGVNRDPCFCCKGPRNIDDEEDYMDPEQLAGLRRTNNAFNPEDPIRIEKLKKKFGDFTAVDDICLSIRQDEIFTILGHNGAGKTTTIYMLTGVLKPSGGNAFVYGNDIVNRMHLVQQNLGLCQQFDVLFDMLTIREHLQFACEIKNMDATKINQAIDETLREVMLTEHADKKVQELSGGMKRKLSLAIAIVTRPKVIILDEPTSGLDVESRQQVWHLIKKIKQGRSIIMSSQHLEEADELADRVCIMTKGKLLALDTPYEIKRQFGFGYKIIVEPRNCLSDDFMHLKENVIDPIILSPVNVHAGVTESADSTTKKLIYQMPFTEVRNLQALFEQLEGQILHAAYLDIEMNSLEDAYINIAKEEEKLLEELNEYGMRRRKSSVITNKNRSASQSGSIDVTLNKKKVDTGGFGSDETVDEADLERYFSVVKSPNCCRQFYANYKRRIIQVCAQPREAFLIINPIIFALQSLVTVNIVISVVSHTPDIVKKISPELTFEGLKTSIVSVLYPLYLEVGLILSSGLFMNAVTVDYFEGLRHLLSFAGMRSISYQSGLILAEYTLYLIPGFSVILVGVVLNIDSFRTFWAEFALVIIFFGFPFITISNLFGFMLSSCLKSSPSDAADQAFKQSHIPNLLLYGVASGAAGAASMFGNNQLGFLNYLVPFGSFQILVSKITEYGVQNYHEDLLKFMAPYLAALLVQALVFFALIVYLDYRRNTEYRGADGNSEYNERLQLEEGADVLAFKQMSTQIWNNGSEDGREYLIQARDLMKVYQTNAGGIAAVNKNTFAIAKGEVFGLLGPNGAGKSSTFNILTLNMQRSSGDCKIHMTDIDVLDVYGQGITMGMVPQHNTIWGYLTVGQSLQYMGEVKGMTQEEIDFQKEFIMDMLDLLPFETSKAVNLSGGNKRKLVCAMSLIGYPQIEFLDEPTTGVDPVSCRSLFKMLKKLKDSSMVLTTHRMDEAESLCDNLVIQINGRFVCYGSPGQLKSTYGKGYTIMMKCSESNLKMMEDYVTLSMPYMSCESIEETKMKSSLGEKIFEATYKVTLDINSQQVGGLSSLFAHLCAVKYGNTEEVPESIIRDFSVTRSSLEQVFVQFAKHQIEQNN